MRDFSLVFGGIPADSHWTLAAISVAKGPKEFMPLGEQNNGLQEKYLDSDNPSSNQSHHYSGLLFLGYFFGSNLSRPINTLREIDTSNQGDILLGEAAISDAIDFRSDFESYEDLIDKIRALAVDSD
ncbi:hypothetical protein ADN00_02285 [Ornatilinea apprima]|uniref:Uncharacterized protein n=2 Tax=Ornatilinea apprima TaxID=1134406 RepID=A0A0P6XBR3_9CHLR|nr:hypothetical protein ADN00_02285 [Ornatilinea apprima]